MSISLMPYEMILVRKRLVANVTIDFLTVLAVEVQHLLVSFVNVQALVVIIAI